MLDTHLHLRKDADACFTHMQGCGVTNAILLTPATDQDRAKQEMEHRPGRFARSVRTDPAVSGADKVLRDALKAGAVSIGEMKFNVALDSPEMRRVYDIAAEMKVPVMMHIQTFPISRERCLTTPAIPSSTRFFERIRGRCLSDTVTSSGPTSVS